MALNSAPGFTFARSAKTKLALALIAGLLWAQPMAQAASFAQRPEVHQFVVAMADKHGFDVGELSDLFARIKPRPGVARTMTERVVTPAPWVRYRSNCVNSWNINHGVDFWEANAAALARARQVYGVPEEVIVAIIGVETRYGKARLCLIPCWIPWRRWHSVIRAAPIFFAGNWNNTCC